MWLLINVLCDEVKDIYQRSQRQDIIHWLFSHGWGVRGEEGSCKEVQDKQVLWLEAGTGEGCRKLRVKVKEGLSCFVPLLCTLSKLDEEKPEVYPTHQSAVSRWGTSAGCLGLLSGTFSHHLSFRCLGSMQGHQSTWARPGSGIGDEVAMPHNGAAVGPDHQEGTEGHMPAEESGGKRYVMFVIVHPLIAGDWSVQHEAYLHQPGARDKVQKGLQHPDQQHVGSPQFDRQHQGQQKQGLDEQHVRAELHSFCVLHMRHHQGQKETHAQRLGTLLQNYAPLGQQVLADHVHAPTQKEGRVEREMLPLFAVHEGSLVIHLAEEHQLPMNAMQLLHY